MTITLFVKPESLKEFIYVTSILKDVGIENNFVFDTFELCFSESMISDWLWINMDISEYIKFKYCIEKQNRKLK